MSFWHEVIKDLLHIEESDIPQSSEGSKLSTHLFTEIEANKQVGCDDILNYVKK